MKTFSSIVPALVISYPLSVMAQPQPQQPQQPQAQPTVPTPDQPTGNPTTVPATEQTTPTQPSTPVSADRGALVIGLKVGGLFAQPFTQGRLGASFLVNAEVGYVLPFLNRSFGLLIDVGYTQPTASGTQMDPRVTANSGSYSWNLTQQELLLGFTVMYRMTFINQGRIAPYIGIGPRLWFLRTRVQGAAGMSTISETTEQGLRVGFSVPLGVEIALGPGRIFGEALILWAPIDLRITGESSVGSLNILAGYRLWL